MTLNGSIPGRRAFRLLAGSALLAISGSLAATPATAQDSQIAPADAEQPGASVGPDIVVTAEKRSSTVQKTAISMTAISGEDLQRRGLHSVRDLIAEVPGVSVVSAGPGQTVFTIRGLAADGGQAATAGLYLDETPVTPPAQSETGKVALDPNLYDLSRVEVLRGPQGTLYGAGSMGGTIKLVTNQPDFSRFYVTAETIASGTEGGGFNVTQNAMVNVPLVADALALRVVGTAAHNSGWIDRVVISDFPLETDPVPGFYGATRGDVLSAPVTRTYKNVNDSDLTSVRASLLLKPVDALSITGAIFHQTIETGGPTTFDDPPGGLAHYQPFDIAEPFSDKFTIYSVNAQLDFSAVRVTSATSYLVRDNHYIQDSSEITQSGFQLSEFSADNGLGVGPAATTDDMTTRQFTQEIRIASNGDGPFQWLVGGFYSHYKFTFEANSDIPGLGTLYGGALGSSSLFHIISPFDVKQKALFANASYAVSDKLKLTGGLRYFSYKSHVSSTNSGVATGSLDPVTESASADDSGFNPMANISFTPTRNLMFYATAAKGFREGGANYPVPTTGQVGEQCLAALQALGYDKSPLQYGPDSVWSYELGQKASLLGGRIVFNSDAYYIKWSKVQSNIALGCGYGFTANAAAGEVKGLEAEARVGLFSGLTLTQTVGYADAKFTEDSAGAGISKGDPFLLVPKWTVSTSLDYRQDIGGHTAFVGRVSNSYVSRALDVTYNGEHDIPSRNIVSGRIGLDFGDKSIFLFADNLLNEHAALANVRNISFGVPSFDRVSSNQPLTIGLDFSVKL